jgi:beta-galactosidase
MSFFSGIVDSSDRVHLGGYPGPFRELLGLTVEEFWPLPAGGTISLDNGTATVWSEWISPSGAEVLATFADGELAGRPAITRNTFGEGVATYLGTRPDETTMANVIGHALAAAGVEPVLPGIPDGVEAVIRSKWLFLLNHNTTEVAMPIPANAIDALSGEPYGNEVQLAGRGVVVARLA